MRILTTVTAAVLATAVVVAVMWWWAARPTEPTPPLALALQVCEKGVGERLDISDTESQWWQGGGSATSATVRCTWAPSGEEAARVVAAVGFGEVEVHVGVRDWLGRPDTWTVSAQRSVGNGVESVQLAGGADDAVQILVGDAELHRHGDHGR